MAEPKANKEAEAKQADLEAKQDSKAEKKVETDTKIDSKESSGADAVSEKNDAKKEDDAAASKPSTTQKQAFARPQKPVVSKEGASETSAKVEAKSKPSKQDAELKGIVRIIDRDIVGTMPIRYAIARGKGVSFMMANAICSVLKLNPDKKVGHTSTEELKKIEDCARNPAKYVIPNWLFNRRKDLETGEDKHLVSAELDLNKTFDIRLLRKIKSYKGVRHSLGSKTLRGQRTKTGARKKKSALGVQRKKKSGKKG